MLSQLLNQMDEYLSNRPFKRRWWSKGWKSYMSIHPPLSKEAPLWKRSIEELRSLRLFDLTPEELSRIIEAYWKMPRWRRWFSYFGMNKKIDVWNYYQRCAAYQAVRPDNLEPSSVSSENKSFFNELALCLYQANVKLETYLEQRCRDPKWIEEHYSEEIESYKQRLKDTFLTKLHKSLKKIKTEDERVILKKQAEQDYQQVEALMLDYYRQRLKNFFSHRYKGDFVQESAAEVIQDEEWVDLEEAMLELKNNLEQDQESVMVVTPGSSQPVSSSSPLPVSRNVHPTEINPLREATEWIKKQRQCLELLVKEDALQKVEDLLKTSLNEIKAITELYFDRCETELSEIKGKPKDYGAFLKSFDDLQRQLKSLLQGGMLLFHPDHVISSTSSQAMRDLICHYSQCYIEQNRDYLDKFENYRLRIEELSLLEQKKLQRQKLPSEWSDLRQSIHELNQSIEELKQSFKNFGEELREIEAQRIQDNEAFEAQRANDKAESEAKLQEVQDKSEAKIQEVQAQRIQDKEAFEAQRANDKEAFEAQRASDKAELEAKLKALEARFSQFFTPSTQPALESRSATASNEESPESSHNTRFFKPYLSRRERGKDDMLNQINKYFWSGYAF